MIYYNINVKYTLQMQHVIVMMNIFIIMQNSNEYKCIYNIFETL